MKREALIRNICLAGILSTVAALATAHSWGRQSAPADDFTALVTVSVRGTRATLVPHSVDVIVAEPTASAKRVVARGGKRLDSDGPSVLYDGVEYRFSSPAEWTERSSKALRLGDVVYTFWVDDTSARREFLRRFAVTKEVGRIRWGDGGSSTIFEASPGYLMLVLAPTVTYRCGVHGNVRRREPGTCTECGLELIKELSYR